jgi:large conductance mechanosensitive channel
MGFIQEFREFAMRGNVIDLAVGVVIGGAFGKIVSSFVSNIVMPPLNLLTAKYGVNFSDMSYKVFLKSPQLDPATGTPMKDAAGNTIMVDQWYPILNYGPFVQTIVDFLIVAIAIFLAIKLMNTAKKRFEKQQVAAAAAAPPEDVQLLREIRDALLKK